MAPKKKPRTVRRRRTHPVTKQELQENNPSIVEGVTKKLGPLYKLAIAVTAIGTMLYGGAYFWTSIGGQWFVSDHTLDRAINNVKTEVGIKLDSTKNEVVQNQITMKDQITGSIGELTKTLGSISKSQNASAMESADMAMKLAFTQLQSLQGQLATVKLALSKDPNDSMLQTRVLQLETFIKQNERDMQDAKDKQSRLRNGQ